MTVWPFKTDKTTRAERFLKNLRAFFCLCLLLPLYAVPEREPLRVPGAGMDAPPPPALEALPRLGAFGGTERRPLGGVPVASSPWLGMRVWHVLVPVYPVAPERRRVTLAEFQQWRLEGG